MALKATATENRPLVRIGSPRRICDRLARMPSTVGAPVHIYRWDLDRTYLDTEIHSVRGLVRAAFETAADKKTVPGAAALLKAVVAHDPEARIYVLSGSPTQMRAVLEQKLALDGVRIDGLFLKDNLGN